VSPASRILPVAEGITNPPIDELLTKTDSKYKLVLYSAKRARQINAYYSQLGEGLLEYVGPLVDTHVQEKPLSIALREINEDLLTCEDVDPDAEGVTNPSIDDLLTKTDSKYKLVLYSAKRARQINAYYSQLGEGLLEYVGPLVDTHVQEKPLSIALREINDDLLTCEDVDPAELAAEEEAKKAAALEAGFSTDS